jgi:hypothetical protein
MHAAGFGTLFRGLGFSKCPFQGSRCREGCELAKGHHNFFDLARHDDDRWPSRCLQPIRLPIYDRLESHFPITVHGLVTDATFHVNLARRRRLITLNNSHVGFLRQQRPERVLPITTTAR